MNDNQFIFYKNTTKEKITITPKLNDEGAHDNDI